MAAEITDLEQGYPITKGGERANDYFISLWQQLIEAFANTNLTQYEQAVLAGGQTIVPIDPANANFATFVQRSAGTNTILTLDDYTVNNADQITLAVGATAGDKLFVTYVAPL